VDPSETPLDFRIAVGLGTTRVARNIEEAEGHEIQPIERQLRLANVRRADVGARAPLRTVEVIATGARAAGALVNEVAALGMAADGAKKRESTGTDQMLGGFAAIARNG